MVCITFTLSKGCGKILHQISRTVSELTIIYRIFGHKCKFKVTCTEISLNASYSMAKRHFSHLGIRAYTTTLRVWTQSSSEVGRNRVQEVWEMSTSSNCFFHDGRHHPNIETNFKQKFRWHQLFFTNFVDQVSSIKSMNS